MQGPWSDGVPSGWQIRPLWSEFRRGKTLGDGSEELLSVYRDYGVIPKFSRDDNFNKPSEDLSKYQRVSVGDLVVNKMKAWQGSLGISNHDGIVSPAYFVYKAIGTFERRFAHYLLRSKEYADHMAAISSGIRPNQWDLDPAQFAVTPLLVPPPAEQRSIADYLDRETAQIDAFIAKNEELITLLTERRAASIDDAFMRLDAEHTRLKYCAAIQTGVTLGGDGDPADPEWPYLRVANVQVGRVVLEDVKTIRVPEARARQSMLSVGDVLMTEGGDRDKLGRGALWSGDVTPMLHQNHVFAVKVAPNLNARFLMRWLDASPSREYFETTAVQTTNLASTNKTLVGNLPMPSCPVEAQLTLVEVLDSRLKKIDETIAVAEQSVTLARERRAALISSAVTGKIDVGVSA
ncbi:restriction endonuclease subunit S [Microbacterium luteum]|uniref:restriction endonuclease subunit S n=1 Tax=Microbacterium luteum TaxID=2782167 RepID=UPI001E5DBB20|nr:restriction endonuclease subunit S [Microbacterium luteum]